MQDSQGPTKVSIIWASSAGPGFVREVPDTSQIGVHDGFASWPDGFPPLNFQPKASGGVPPYGADFNGVLHRFSEGLRWLEAGSPLFWDPAFSTAIGGYPRGAVVTSLATLGQFWISTVDNNPTNPDAGGANWLGFGVITGAPISGRTQIFTASGTFTVPTGVTSVEVEVIGGGGGGGTSGDGSGGGTVGNVGGGGGAGGYGYKRIGGLTPAATVAVTVGAAGAAPSGAGVAGDAGGTSSFGASVSCTSGGGGNPGTFTLGNGGAGGTATGAELSIPGGGGGFSGPNVGGVTLSDAERMYSRGGLPGKGFGTVTWGGTGAPGQGYGSGGGGASGGSGLAGGAGAPGLVIVRW